MTGHQVVLTTADGARLELCCPPGATVLEAAAEAGAALPASCKQGTCGSCHATVTSGAYDLGPHSPLALPDDELPGGGVLLCRTVPCGPLTATLPYPQSRILYGGVPQRAAEIVSLTPVARDTLHLVLALTDSPDCQFDAGQFVELERPGTGIRRAYSLANTGNWDGRMEFYLRHRPDGAFSAPLAERARPGDPLTVHGPQGAFGLHETGLRPRWLLAGGTGLAPLLAMARQAAEWQDPQPTRLFLGANTPADLFGAAELDAVAAELPGFSHELCVRESDDGWSGPVGTPADLLARALADHTGPAPDLYVCGPPPMVDAVRRAAPGCRLFHERFLAT
ncbi:2Fe-2S iron-sulfur cluster-binding protein [Kitasatospora sp. NPDC059795]|uniref:2Fe-2S iron-sulfur cluster-binding protein n=1 Tax=Kitasatospora sp. NPDC059795 TaxID=3346949 RepID=UPI00364712D2